MCILVTSGVQHMLSMDNRLMFHLNGHNRWQERLKKLKLIIEEWWINIMTKIANKESKISSMSSNCVIIMPSVCGDNFGNAKVSRGIFISKQHVYAKSTLHGNRFLNFWWYVVKIEKYIFLNEAEVSSSPNIPTKL